MTACLSPRCLVPALFLALAACASTPEGAIDAPTLQPAVAVPPASLAAAEQALAHRRPDEARRQFQRILQREPGNARARLGLARAQLALGAPRDALELLAGLDEVAELRLASLEGKGLALLAVGEHEAGGSALQAVVAEEPRLWRAWNGLGRYHDRAGRFGEAEQAYRRALEAAPTSAVTLNNLGVSLMMQRRYDEAADHFTRALEIDPRLENARTNLRLALAFNGRYAEALSGVSPSERPQALNNLGFVALLQGEYQRAETYFVRALEASPSFYEPAWKNLELLASIQDMNAR